ncbi:MAG: hypothetical protein KA715_00280 [Xanthomonadaceae bacterium]|nr:hypothetical protein [Xanthomonadaceae bacterium]
MFEKFCITTSLFLFSVSASATVYKCNLQKVPPLGIEVAAEKYIKVFTFDTADVPAEKEITFDRLKLSLYSDGYRIQMKISNSIHESLSSFSSRESELYMQLDSDAVGICLTDDATKDAVSIESSQ